MWCRWRALSVPRHGASRRCTSAIGVSARDPIDFFLQRSFVGGLKVIRRIDECNFDEALQLMTRKYFPRPCLWTLREVQRIISGDVKRTLDWFHYNRLAGNPAAMHSRFVFMVVLALSCADAAPFAIRSVIALGTDIEAPVNDPRRMTKRVANVLMRSLAREGDLNACCEWLDEMKARQVPANACTYAHIIRSCRKTAQPYHVASSYFDEARRVDKDSKHRLQAYNAMLQCVVRLGRLRDVEQLLCDMSNHGPVPDTNSFDIILLALAKANRPVLFDHIWARRVAHVSVVSNSTVVLVMRAWALRGNHHRAIALFNSQDFRHWAALLAIGANRGAQELAQVKLMIIRLQGQRPSINDLEQALQVTPYQRPAALTLGQAPRWWPDILQRIGLGDSDLPAALHQWLHDMSLMRLPLGRPTVGDHVDMPPGIETLHDLASRDKQYTAPS